MSYGGVIQYAGPGRIPVLYDCSRVVTPNAADYPPEEIAAEAIDFLQTDTFMATAVDFWMIRELDRDNGVWHSYALWAHSDRIVEFGSDQVYVFFRAVV